jgi:nitrite reductase/ring-hydroxylating ferredoxin subunit
MTKLIANSCHDCDASCASETSRRTFLKGAGAVFSLVALGLAEVDAAPLPTAIGAAGAVSGSERLYPIPASDGVTIDRKNQLIVVRYQQHLYAFNLACPHENTALKWLPKDQRFQCPKHESRYQPNGIFIDGRATRHMDRLGVRLEDNMLAVDVNKFYKSDKDPSGWAAATVSV